MTTLKHSPNAPLILRFFDLEVSLRTDDALIFQPFELLYSSFRSHAASGAAVARMSVEFRRNAEDGGSLWIDGERWPVSRSMCQTGALYEFLLKCIYERIRSHILIHASALCLDGVGLLVVGDSGFGKSTLALSLANRGADFLSDEVGAVRRSDCQLEAFPRRMRVRDESLELAELDLRNVKPDHWFGKRLLDIERVRPGIISAPCPIGAVVFLMDHREIEENLERRDVSKIEFLLGECDAELLSFVSRQNAVESVEREDSGGFTTLTVSGERIGSVAAELEAYCRERRICVLDAASPVTLKPDFSSEPILSPIEAKHALGRLLQQFLPGRGSQILRHEFSGKSTRLLLEMMSLFRGASFFELVVGDMPLMVKQVESMMRALSTAKKRTLHGV